MRLRTSWIGWIVPLVLLGCAQDERVVAPLAPVAADDLSGASYNVVAKNPSESVILLGQIRFAAASGGELTGSWSLRQWSGSDVPGLPGEGELTGALAGNTAILRLALPGTESSLGMVAEGFREGRLTGKISLLPSLGFDGRFEAIRAENP
jgi:hypothetical protein